VSLTYHRKSNLLKCHHCGYQVKPVNRCGECGSSNLKLKGFGTEKINDELETIFPQAKIARMDLDTTRGKNSHQKIIEDFSQQKIDILVGTQMVTKGLDFNHVSLVGILNADHLIAFPDFRAFERSFQVMAQVSGRAGRKHTRGKVVIQTYHPYHSCIRYVMENNYSELFVSQMQERQLFRYPPYVRLIKIMVKHQREEVVNKAGDQFAALLKKELPHTILGPEFPLISRIKNQFIKEIWIKIDHAMGLKETKQKLIHTIEYFKKSAGFSSVKITINVDPY
jgi:primosomal protein N' (replication factor Y)